MPSESGLDRVDLFCAWIIPVDGTLTGCVDGLWLGLLSIGCDSLPIPVS